MKKRERKMEAKQRDAETLQKHRGLNAQDRQVLAEIKQNRRDVKKRRKLDEAEAATTAQSGRKGKLETALKADNFDNILESYKSKILKRLEAAEQGESGSTL